MGVTFCAHHLMTSARQLGTEKVSHPRIVLYAVISTWSSHMSSAAGTDQPLMWWSITMPIFMNLPFLLASNVTTLLLLHSMPCSFHMSRLTHPAYFIFSLTFCHILFILLAISGPLAQLHVQKTWTPEYFRSECYSGPLDLHYILLLVSPFLYVHIHTSFTLYIPLILCQTVCTAPAFKYPLHSLASTYSFCRLLLISIVPLQILCTPFSYILS